MFWDEASAEETFGLQPQAKGHEGAEARKQQCDFQSQRGNLLLALPQGHGMKFVAERLSANLVFSSDAAKPGWFDSRKTMLMLLMGCPDVTESTATQPRFAL